MNASTNIYATPRKVLLSTIWIFVVLNYLYCDVLSLMDANLLKQYLAGDVVGLQLTQGFLLGAAILMQVSMIMVVLSRVLHYKANRWANIVAGSITTAVQVVSLTLGTSTMYYWFFSIFENTGTVLIVWLAWTWRHPEA